MRIGSTYSNVDYSEYYKALQSGKVKEEELPLLSILLTSSEDASPVEELEEARQELSIAELIKDMEYQPNARKMRPKPPEENQELLETALAILSKHETDHVQQENVILEQTDAQALGVVNKALLSYTYFLSDDDV